MKLIVQKCDNVGKFLHWIFQRLYWIFCNQLFLIQINGRVCYWPFKKNFPWECHWDTFEFFQIIRQMLKKVCIINIWEKIIHIYKKYASTLIGSWRINIRTLQHTETHVAKSQKFRILAQICKINVLKIIKLFY